MSRCSICDYSHNTTSLFNSGLAEGSFSQFCKRTFTTYPDGRTVCSVCEFSFNGRGRGMVGTEFDNTYLVDDEFDQ